MEIIEDTIAASGMHDLRILLDDGNCVFMQFANVPSLSRLGEIITNRLKRQEFEDIIRSDSWRNPVYGTKAEFAAQFRELYQSARGDEAIRLSHWLAARIDDGTFTDKQTLSVENTSLKELSDIKEKLQEKQAVAIEVLDPKEEEPIKDAEPVVGK